METYKIYQKLDGLDGLSATWTVIGETDNINYIDKLAEGFAKVTKAESGKIKYEMNHGLEFVLIKDGRKYNHQKI